MTDDADLTELTTALRGLGFGLVGSDPDGLRQERDRLVRLLTGIVARTGDRRSPLLVVVAGGSGAGKSTLVNTLAGREIAHTGVLRPTTRVATLVHHPDDEADRLLPGLGRVGTTPEPLLRGRTLRVAVSAAVPRGLTLLDTPDVDSVERDNLALTEELLDAADVWVWAVTPRTYADAAGMQVLRRARSRQALLVVVLTQLRPHERDEVPPDLRRLLDDEGLGAAQLRCVAHARVTAGQLPAGEVTQLASGLAELAAPARREEVRAGALAGLHRALPSELADLTTAVTAEVATGARLRRIIQDGYAGLAGQLDAAIEAGLPLRGEVLRRWQELVGATDLTERLRSTTGAWTTLLRTRLGLPVQPRADEVTTEVTDALAGTVTVLLERVHEQVRADLEADPVGRRLLDTDPDLRRPRAELPDAAQALVTAWQQQLVASVAEVTAPRLGRARRLTTTVNAVAGSAMLVLFSLSGGLTGGEAGIAAAATATSQLLLQRLVGERALRRLQDDARLDLQRRVGVLAEQQRAGLLAAIDHAGPDPEAVTVLRRATGASP